MTVNWIREDEGLHRAKCLLGTGEAVHLLVESLGEHGWDWQVWNATDYCRTQYGVADTLTAAKSAVERAFLSEMSSQDKQAA